jgi:hypothetical protein
MKFDEFCDVLSRHIHIDPLHLIIYQYATQPIKQVFPGLYIETQPELPDWALTTITHVWPTNVHKAHITYLDEKTSVYLIANHIISGYRILLRGSTANMICELLLIFGIERQIAFSFARYIDSSCIISVPYHHAPFLDYPELNKHIDTIMKDSYFIALMDYNYQNGSLPPPDLPDVRSDFTSYCRTQYITDIDLTISQRPIDITKLMILKWSEDGFVAYKCNQQWLQRVALFPYDNIHEVYCQMLAVYSASQCYLCTNYAIKSCKECEVTRYCSDICRSKDEWHLVFCASTLTSIDIISAHLTISEQLSLSSENIGSLLARIPFKEEHEKIPAVIRQLEQNLLDKNTTSLADFAVKVVSRQTLDFIMCGRWYNPLNPVNWLAYLRTYHDGSQIITGTKTFASDDGGKITTIINNTIDE